MIRHSLIRSSKFVWDQDPGLDKPALEFQEAWKRCLETSDVSLLVPVTREGQKLTVFDLEPLTRKEFMRVFALEGLERICEAVAYGVKGVANFEIDGSDVRLERDRDSKRLTAKSLDLIYDPILFATLGSRVMEISQIDPTKG